MKLKQIIFNVGLKCQKNKISMIPTKENRSMRRNSRNFTILIQKFTYAPN
jgi:hypothetical protein